MLKLTASAHVMGLYGNDRIICWGIGDRPIVALVTDIGKRIERFQGTVQSAERTLQFIEDFSRQNRQLATFYQDHLCSELAHRGWFIGGSLYPSQYGPLGEALRLGWEPEIEEFLKAHTEKSIPAIRRSALSRWPSRQQILTDAFDAHVAGKYTLSVPVLLSQADGISADLLDAFLFTNRPRPISEAAENLIEERFSARPLAKSFLGLLLEGLHPEKPGLRLRTSKRDNLIESGQIVSPLNRHGVLHGLDCDYATDANSLRGIALIGFLDWVAVVKHQGDKESPNKAIDGDEG